MDPEDFPAPFHFNYSAPLRRIVDEEAGSGKRELCASDDLVGFGGTLICAAPARFLFLFFLLGGGYLVFGLLVWFKGKRKGMARHGFRTL